MKRPTISDAGLARTIEIEAVSETEAINCLVRFRRENAKTLKGIPIYVTMVWPKGFRAEIVGAD